MQQSQDEPDELKTAITVFQDAEADAYAEQLIPGADPVEFIEPEPCAAPADSWTVFPRRQQLPRTPKYPFFLQHRFD